MRVLRLSGLALMLTMMAGVAQARDAADPAPPIAYDYSFDRADTRLAGAEGQWTGSWNGHYVDGRYEGTFQGTYQPAQIATRPVTQVTAAMPANGYPYGSYTVPIIVRMEPVVTKTVTVVEEIVGAE